MKQRIKVMACPTSLDLRLASKSCLCEDLDMVFSSSSLHGYYINPIYFFFFFFPV